MQQNARGEFLFFVWKNLQSRYCILVVHRVRKNTDSQHKGRVKDYRIYLLYTAEAIGGIEREKKGYEISGKV